MCVNGRSQCGQHTGQHDAFNSNRQHISYSGCKQNFPTSHKFFPTRSSRIERINDQQSYTDNEPEETTQEYLQPGKSKGSHFRIFCALASHHALSKITRAIAVAFKKPLKAYDNKEWHEGFNRIGAKRKNLACLDCSIKLHKTFDNTSDAAGLHNDHNGVNNRSYHCEAELHGIGGNN